MPDILKAPQIERHGPSQQQGGPRRVCSRRIATAVSLLAMLVVAFVPGAARADQAGFAYLEIPTGARASALGGAYTSLSQGADAIFWNPAGLAHVRKVQIAGGHYELFQNLRHDHFAIAGQVLGGGLGASVRALYTEAIDERDELGNLIGTFGSHDLDFALAYGTTLTAGMAAGASAQIVSERIASATATTYAFGLGATWDVPALNGLRASLAATNLGPSTNFKDGDFKGEDVPLPASIQGGAAYAFRMTPQFDLRAAVESRLSRGRSAVGMLGAEVVHTSGAALRLGWRGGDTTTNFSAGVGYVMGGLELDYAYVPFKLDLGDTHRFAFVAQF